MKKILTLATLLFLFSSNLYSQGFITLQSGETTTIYKAIDDAYEAANDGDVIILPGGLWKGLTKPILKSISIIGSGYDLRYSSATGVTTCSGNIEIRTGNVTIEGIHLLGDIIFNLGESPEFSNIIISRSRFTELRFGNLSITVSNVLIKESIFDNIRTSSMSIPQLSHSLVTNCFISGTIQVQIGLKYKNNIIFSKQPHQLVDIEFSNNIFTHWTGQLTGTQTRISFSNNIFAQDANIDYSFVNTGNKFNIGNGAIFEEIPEGDTFTFDYTHTYKLKANSPAKNAGNDGTDCGVWGGAYPWKEVAVPMNPYIKEANIAPATNAQGILNVKFKIEAQTK